MKLTNDSLTKTAYKPFFGGLLRIFLKMGSLPFLLVLGIFYFSAVSDNFLSLQNFKNVIRQSSYLVLVSIGQMFPLLTGGFDLSVGTVIALSSVVGATIMASMHAAFPEMIGITIMLGLSGGILAGGCIGAVNGLGVSIFGVSPFMMTLGMTSVGFGIALYMTGGTPVYGMPAEFANVFGFGEILGIPSPVFVTICFIFAVYILVNRTRLGRYLYAVGGNKVAAELSGINTGLVLFIAYLASGLITAVTGMLLTARLDTGEANIGASMPLESIAACVIAGVSLRGGIGRPENVVMGALFIGLVQNGMNLARIESYLQTVVIGALLIFAVVADQLRLKIIAKYNQ